MYRLLIVDDEYPVRAGLRTVVPWERVGCQVVGEASNGRQALAFLEGAEVDLVLTDIKMPVMDGLEFMKAARGNGFDGEFIVLTCYAEFGLAQEALRAGAADYVLKAEISPEELLAIVHRVGERLTARRVLHGRADASRDLLRQEFYRRLVREGMEAAEIHAGLKDLGPELPERNLRLILVSVDGPQASRAGEEEIRRCLGEVSCGRGYWVTEAGDFLGFIALADEAAASARRALLERWSEAIHRELGKEFGLSATVGLSAEHQTHAAWPSAYREAREAVVSARFLRGPGQTLFFDMLPVKVQNPLTPEEIDRLALAALVEGDLTGIEARLSSLESRSAVQAGALAILLACGRYLNECGRVYARVFGSRDLYAELHDCPDVAAVTKLLAEVTGEVRRHLAWEGCEGRSAVHKAAGWIRQHYTEEITLPRLAREVGLNPSYLSALFKREMGQSFMEFLTKVRIEKAKELLMLPGLKNQEIAEAVGYPNPHYFSRIFRRVTGLTPSDYRGQRPAPPKI